MLSNPRHSQVLYRAEHSVQYHLVYLQDRQLCQQFDLPLDFEGTVFQKKVWQALLSIPFGETRSYRDIAEQVGNIKAVRAVGAANGKNPISIIAPCHRVVGVNGKLVGFAGGLNNKEILLGLEKQ